MIIESRAPVVTGSFDADRARKLAAKLLARDQCNAPNGELPAVVPLQNNHFVSHDSARASKSLLKRIGFSLKPDVPVIPGYMFRVQNATDARQVAGGFWHDDGDALRVGVSDFPTLFLVGTVDISLVVQEVNPAVFPYLSRQDLINEHREPMARCVEQALSCGTAELQDPFEPGTIVDVPAGTIHKSNIPLAVTSGPITVPRLIIASMLYGEA